MKEFTTKLFSMSSLILSRASSVTPVSSGSHLCEVFREIYICGFLYREYMDRLPYIPHTRDGRHIFITFRVIHRNVVCCHWWGDTGICNQLTEFTHDQRSYSSYSDSVVKQKLLC